MAEEKIEEISGEIAGQKFSLRSVALNTVLTFLTFMVSFATAYVLYNHTGESKEVTRELSMAMKELAQANREQNCLLIFEQKDRQLNAANCKMLSR